jgi:hypothetical protein
LGTIDRYRFLKNFHVPQLRDILKMPGALPAGFVPQQQRLLEICGEDKLEFETRGDGHSKSFTYFGTSKHWPTARLIGDRFSYPDEMFRITRKDVVSLSEKGEQATCDATVSQLIGKGQAKAQSACNNLFKTLFEELKEAEQFVVQMESRKSALTF